MASTKPAENGSKKTTAKKTATSKAPTIKVADKTTTSSRKKNSTAPVITSASRLQKIEVAAYYIAEKQGFNNQHVDHWLAAEKEIDSMLNA